MNNNAARKLKIVLFSGIRSWHRCCTQTIFKSLKNRLSGRPLQNSFSQAWQALTVWWLLVHSKYFLMLKCILRNFIENIRRIHLDWLIQGFLWSSRAVQNQKVLQTFAVLKFISSCFLYFPAFVQICKELSSPNGLAIFNVLIFLILGVLYLKECMKNRWVQLSTFYENNNVCGLTWIPFLTEFLKLSLK